MSFRTLLLISNVEPPCRLLTSETQRTSAFGRYLPAHGWRCIHLVLDCHCRPSAAGDDREWILPPHTTLGPADLRQLRERLSDPEGRPLVVRLQGSPRWFLRTFLALCRLEGHSYADDRDRRDMHHFIFPQPQPGPTAGEPRLAALIRPLRVAAGLFTNRLHHEQERIDWRRRGRDIGIRLARELGVDAIAASYSTAQNLVIGRDVSRATGRPLLADFRDAASARWGSGKRRGRELRQVRAVLRHSRAITAVTPQEGERDLCLSPRPRYVIENGYADEAWGEPPASGNDALTIRFLGAIYPERNLDVFLAGLGRLAAATDSAPPIRFEYYGPSAAEAAEAVRTHGVEALCEIHETVPADEALALTRSATALLLATNTVGLSGVPGAKFYEYLASLRPILAAGGKDDYIDGILARTGSGVGCHTADGVAEALGRWLDRWRRDDGRLVLDIDEDQVRRYSRRRGAAKLAAVLDAMVDGVPLDPATLDNL